MDLWIRSQNRKMMEKAVAIKIAHYMENETNSIVINNDYVFGEYATEERALEVLDEIQIRLINLQLVGLEEKGQARKDARINDELKCIYEMPKE